MSKKTSKLSFQLMTLCFAVRDLIWPVKQKLHDKGIERGHVVLDYGCGPGSYSFPAAELVGNSGRVFAADVNPHALDRVRSRAAGKGLSNIETILTDCRTGLPDSSVHVAFLFDTYHDLADPEAVTNELYRVLKPDGILLFSDHHMKDPEILSGVQAGNRFTCVSHNGNIFTFRKGR
jgi:ubiquinone/menaquinone biosynthesis C-methylase UbiE